MKISLAALSVIIIVMAYKCDKIQGCTVAPTSTTSTESSTTPRKKSAHGTEKESKTLYGVSLKQGYHFKLE